MRSIVKEEKLHIDMRTGLFCYKGYDIQTQDLPFILARAIAFVKTNSIKRYAHCVIKEERIYL